MECSLQWKRSLCFSVCNNFSLPQELENILGPRPSFQIPIEHEEVNMQELTNTGSGEGYGNAYDEDEESHHGPQVQCASQ